MEFHHIAMVWYRVECKACGAEAWLPISGWWHNNKDHALVEDGRYPDRLLYWRRFYSVVLVWWYIVEIKAYTTHGPETWLPISGWWYRNCDEACAELIQARHRNLVGRIRPFGLWTERR